MSLIPQSIALVTGGCSGLGAQVVRRLLANNVKGVLAFDLQANPSANSTKNLELFKGDVSSEADVAKALDYCESKFGAPPRIIVNAAGIAPTIRIISGKGVVHPLDAFERCLKVNVVGTFNVMRLASDRMIKKAEPLGSDKQRGVVINTASVAAYDGQIGQIAYSASKGAIVGMCITAARDLAQHGIRVMTLAPGVFKTPMVAGFSQQVQDSLGAQVPFPSRLGDPDEYASMVQTICENTYLNGEVIRLDGAIRMAPR